jgi:hypothetical protein
VQTVTFEYTPELVKRIIGQFMWRQLIPGSALVIALGLAGIITLMGGDHGWFQGATITLFVGYGWLWFRYYRTALNVAQELTNRSVTVKFEAEDVTFQSADHTSIMKWGRIKRIQKLNEAWLFFLYSDNQYTMVPTSVLD